MLETSAAMTHPVSALNFDESIDLLLSGGALTDTCRRRQLANAVTEGLTVARANTSVNSSEMAVH